MEKIRLIKLALYWWKNSGLGNSCTKFTSNIFPQPFLLWLGVPSSHKGIVQENTEVNAGLTGSLHYSLLTGFGSVLLLPPGESPLGCFLQDVKHHLPVLRLLPLPCLQQLQDGCTEPEVQLNRWTQLKSIAGDTGYPSVEDVVCARHTDHI